MTPFFELSQFIQPTTLSRNPHFLPTHQQFATIVRKMKQDPEFTVRVVGTLNRLDKARHSLETFQSQNRSAKRHLTGRFANNHLSQRLQELVQQTTVEYQNLEALGKH